MSGIATDSRNAIFLADGIEHLDGFGGQTDDALWQAGHGQTLEKPGGGKGHCSGPRHLLKRACAWSLVIPFGSQQNVQMELVFL